MKAVLRVLLAPIVIVGIGLILLIPTTRGRTLGAILIAVYAVDRIISACSRG